MMEFCVNQRDFFIDDYNIAGNQTYNGGVFRINHCFRNLLNLVPAIFLIIFTPLVIYDFRTSRNGPLHKKNPITIRMFTCAFLILDVCLQICYLIVNSLINKDGKLQQQNMATPFGQFFSLSMLGLSLLLALFLIMNSLKYGLVSSGVLFNYWLLLAISGAPQFRTTIETLIGQEEEDYFSCALYAIYYIVLIATLILSCFADKPSDIIFTEKTCPEWYVSYLNRLIFWWFNPLANKGNKQDLTFDDLWELPERDKSQYLVEEFGNIRTKQLINYDRQKRKRTKVKLTAKDKADETELLQPNSIEKPKSGETKKELNPPSIIWPLFVTFKFTILGSFLCKVVYDILQFVPPLYLGLIIKFMENRQQPSWIGIGIAFAMFFTSLIQSMFLHQYFHMMLRFGMNIRTILTSAVYKKALLLSNEARKNRTIGEIVNLMTVDIQKLQDISMWIMFIWSAPLQISLSLYFLWKLLGPAIIAGIVCLATFIPINTGITIIMRNMQQRQMALKDERIKLLNEMLNGIRVLKLYAWEKSIENRILEIRQKELKVLKRIAYMNAISSMLWSSAPFLVAVSTFATYLFIDPENNILSPEITFVALSYFNILRFPLAVFPFITSQIVQCNVSNKRLKTFLAEEEIEIVNNAIGNQDLSIAVNNGNFSWDLDGPLILKDINLAVKKGSLVAIVGRIGSGKSSLLSAILGEAYRRSGTIGIDGRVAYVPQQAWIQNMTLRENVLFGAPMDQNKYEQVLDACALEQDLAALPGGDATEIGEKGINLSGGQKQRISLARAAYSDSDIYFLDDPLSAVDSHVGKHIFEKLIGTDKGILRGKTRILVTHGLSFLKYCDQIIVVKDGQMSESGAYQDLLRDSGEFSNLIEEYLQKKGDEAEGEEVLEELGKIDPEKRAKLDRQISEMTSRSTNSPISRNASNEEENPETESTVRHRRHQDSQNAQNGDIPTQTATTGEKKITMGNNKTRIIEKEEIFTGKVKFNVYLGYLQAVSYSICAFFFLIYIGSSILGVACNLWLAKWTDQIQSGKNGTISDETIERLSIFTALGISQAFLIALGSIVMSFGMIYAGRKLHQMMLSNVLRNAMSWFDVTPLGRIMNRFGKDIYMVDFSIPSTLLAFFGNSIYGFLAIIIPILIIPWICPFILALICVYMIILDVDYLDNEIPRSFMSFLRTFFSSLETIIMICYATPQFIVIILPLAIFYGLVLRYYVSTSRQLKRLESTTRSPIYSFFQESVQGASSIRAYNSVDRFLIESQRRVDCNISCFFPSLVANRWLAVRLELVGNAIVFFAALSAVLFRDISSHITPGLVGLSVSYALSVTQTLNWAVRMTSELETNIVAVERIKEYSEPKANEAAVDTPKEIQIPEKWPAKGEILFENLALRYRPDLDLVLRGVTAKINSKEKIGIIGRTGAGKSSLTLALFRLVEPSSGRIVIDDLDIGKLGLHDLRSRLTIVPQDPVIFSGTLRDNLDPFSRHENADIWAALELTHLIEFVRSLPDNLEHKITEGGTNLSVGQRQLICLARALLRQPNILILDEAAASVDIETDHLIQSTIRSQFRECTVLTIAHRLHSVLDSDRLLVFDEGRIVEFDSPQNLFAQADSQFRALALDAGIKNLNEHQTNPQPSIQSPK